MVVSNFNANVSENEVVVKWTSMNEPKDVVYDVLRSEDGKAFVSISKVNGTHLGGANNYEIVDKRWLSMFVSKGKGCFTTSTVLFQRRFVKDKPQEVNSAYI